MPTAIQVEHLSKEYHLGVINHGLLYKDIQSWLARKLGRPDPHAKIGKQHFDDGHERFWALKDVSFSIGQGGRIGVIGRNGAGKSTLLKILSRITAPTEGKVRVRGRIGSLLEVGTGFHHELTGRENILLNRAILGMKRREVARKMDEIIAFSELAQFIDTPVKRYSSGMYVRLAFAVAAHLDSDILLADEVLAVGDAVFQAKCLGKMEDVSRNQGRTVIFVSHNASAVRKLCQDALWLDQGRLRRIGGVEEVLSEYSRTSLPDQYQQKRDLRNVMRYGSGEARGVWAEAAFYSAKGERKSQFCTGDTLELSLAIESVRGVNGVNVACIIYDEFGTRLVDGNLTMLGRSLRLKPGESTLVSWTFKDLLLSQGRYSIGFYIGEPGRDIDGLMDVMAIEVLEEIGTSSRTMFPGRYRCNFSMQQRGNAASDTA